MTNCRRCCQCEGIERLFGKQEAAHKLRAYLRHGPARTTRLLLDALRAEGVDGATLLDIGGGVGVIPLELFSAGLRSATDVDASGEYLAVARAEAQRRGYAGQITYHHGNFVELAREIEPADIVTLDRVLCCYHDMPALVGTSAARARRLYGLVYPRDDWWTRSFSALENATFRMRRHPYRSFVHPAALVDATVRRAGLERRSLRRDAVWQVVVYARP
ncbi:MAG TPA: methyltransferase domain-containing protein [Ktedonobacterales bacterium]|jgi:magnesium-protoporphyrin O-methyltransferase